MTYFPKKNKGFDDILLDFQLKRNKLENKNYTSANILTCNEIVGKTSKMSILSEPSEDFSKTNRIARECRRLTDLMRQENKPFILNNPLYHCDYDSQRLDMNIKGQVSEIVSFCYLRLPLTRSKSKKKFNF